MDFDLCNYNVQQSENTNPSLDCSPAKEEYQSNLAESMFHGKVPNKILAFRGKAPTPGTLSL